MFFSTEDETSAKDFAGRMGLETGWNCFVSLSEEATPASDNKAKLPRGITRIRPHLEVPPARR